MKKLSPYQANGLPASVIEKIKPAINLPDPETYKNNTYILIEMPEITTQFPGPIPDNSKKFKEYRFRKRSRNFEGEISYYWEYQN